MLVDVPRLVERFNMHSQRELGKCLLKSSLPGKALRMLVDIPRLVERFNMHSQSRVSVYPLLNALQTSDYDAFFYFCVDSAS